MNRVRPIRLRRLLPCEAGYTLIEVLTVLVILSVVLGGLTTMFTAGMRAQLRANRELQAQQNARAALDRMRHELHCANAVTGAVDGTPVTTVTLTLPATCASAATTVVYATAVVSANRWTLTRAADGAAAVVVADYLADDDVFTYEVPETGKLGRLRVDFPVNVNPGVVGTQWRLQDDIVLRNTTRL
jgi:prepilin-type N-terminal cleavage/methylation domain-containing protein